MACKMKFIQPIKSWVMQLPFCPSTRFLHSTNSATVIYTKFQPPQLQFYVPVARLISHLRKNPAKKLIHSGTKLFTRSIIGISVAYGYVNFLPNVTYAMDDSHSTSLSEEEGHAFWALMRKVWLPTVFIVTVILNYDHPIMLALKVILGLLSTKPSPLSVYLYVEQLCHQCMLREPHLYGLKPLYANKVEVSDYKLLCLASVQLREQEFTLIGILGGWWALPSSLSQYSIKEHFSSLRTEPKSTLPRVNEDIRQSSKFSASL